MCRCQLTFSLRSISLLKPCFHKHIHVSTILNKSWYFHWYHHIMKMLLLFGFDTQQAHTQLHYSWLKNCQRFTVFILLLHPFHHITTTIYIFKYSYGASKVRQETAGTCHPSNQRRATTLSSPGLKADLQVFVLLITLKLYLFFYFLEG